MDKFRVFVYVLMRDASLKQRIPCIMLNFQSFFSGKKCALYTGKYGNEISKEVSREEVAVLPLTFLLR